MKMSNLRLHIIIVRHACIIFTAWALLFFGHGCSPSQPPKPVKLKSRVVTELKEPLIVPLISKKCPLIHVSIPGYGEGDFIVDTACTHTILDKEFAERCRLPVLEYSGVATVIRSEIQKFDMKHYTKVPRLVIGEATALDIEPPLLSLTHIRDNLSGIVGQDVINNWILLFDASRDQLHIIPDGSIKEYLDARLARPTELCSYELEWSYGRGYITLDISGESMNMIIDTGASNTALPKMAVRNLNLKQEGVTTVRHIGGTLEENRWFLNKLEIGNWECTNLKVDEYTERMGLLGYDVLKLFAFIFDGSRKTVGFIVQPEWK